MRFINLAFSAVALLSAYAAAAPVEERAPVTEAEALEARKVYTSWYRATNINAATNDD